MKSTFIPLLFASSAIALPQLGKEFNRLPGSRLPHRRANQIIPVVVGGPQDTFVPNSLVAAVGDILQFQFSNGNHTVTQSSKDTACTPLEGGIHSGHIPFNDGQADVGTFNLVVTSTDPMFLYCATGPHCQEGQVMIVNPTGAQQIVDYTKLSQATKKSVDGKEVKGGSVGKIQLATAAFVPAPAQDPAAAGPPPPAAAPPAAPPAAAAAPAPAKNATAPAAEAAPKPAPAAEKNATAPAKAVAPPHMPMGISL